MSEMQEDKMREIRRNEIATLVPTKSDKELANELRAEILEVYKPVISVLTKAKSLGFDVAVQTGADGFGQVHLMSVTIHKAY